MTIDPRQAEYNADAFDALLRWGCLGAMVCPVSIVVLIAVLLAAPGC